jgi:hypothetical protein
MKKKGKINLDSNVVCCSKGYFAWCKNNVILIEILNQATQLWQLKLYLQTIKHKLLSKLLLSFEFKKQLHREMNDLLRVYQK